MVLAIGLTIHIVLSCILYRCLDRQSSTCNRSYSECSKLQWHYTKGLTVWPMPEVRDIAGSLNGLGQIGGWGNCRQLFTLLKLRAERYQAWNGMDWGGYLLNKYNSGLTMATGTARIAVTKQDAITWHLALQHHLAMESLVLIVDISLFPSVCFSKNVYTPIM